VARGCSRRISMIRAPSDPKIPTKRRLRKHMIVKNFGHITDLDGSNVLCVPNIQIRPEPPVFVSPSFSATVFTPQVPRAEKTLSGSPHWSVIEMVFPGKLSTCCHVCRRRKVKVSFPISLGSCHNMNDTIQVRRDQASISALYPLRSRIYWLPQKVHFS